jgi:hypothetical protein
LSQLGIATVKTDPILPTNVETEVFLPTEIENQNSVRFTAPTYIRTGEEVREVVFVQFLSDLMDRGI